MERVRFRGKSLEHPPFQPRKSPEVRRLRDDRLWEGYHESRRCSRDTYPESYITKYTKIKTTPDLTPENARFSEQTNVQQGRNGPPLALQRRIPLPQRFVCVRDRETEI